MSKATKEPRVFRPRRVIRSDAGGCLVAPVDQHGVESGDTPSYDSEAVARRCEQLNKRVSLQKAGA